ncbi:unnamed protein product [Caenorhabditis bovis]|uniref:Uncharacterized protein n=1 Tax=Caenorhabditis bovis TaxID=2654633 RepID=A0A8S1EPC9_9PELO|nr:unnamed protein product [Caenorhabditis bovis]
MLKYGYELFGISMDHFVPPSPPRAPTNTTGGATTVSEQNVQVNANPPAQIKELSESLQNVKIDNINKVKKTKTSEFKHTKKETLTKKQIQRYSLQTMEIKITRWSSGQPTTTTEKIMVSLPDNDEPMNTEV